MAAPAQLTEPNSTRDGSPAVRIEHVERIAFDPSALAGANLEAPAAGFVSELYGFPLDGWAVGAAVRVAEIELVGKDGVYGRARSGAHRPDVAEHLGRDDAGGSGFSANVSTLGLPPTFELFARAVLEDGSKHTFAAIRGSAAFTRLPEHASPLPVLVVTLGRTGSTWLMRLLGSDPSIIAYRPFEYEPRVLSYWAKVLLALGAPASYLQPLAARLSSERWWLGDDSVAGTLLLPDEAVAWDLGRAGVDHLATFARTRIAETYTAIADAERRPLARFFAEKVAPERPVMETAAWLYPQARWIYLVRDPRDMALSILAYNQRNRVSGFGRERVKNDIDFIDEVDRAMRQMLQLFREAGSGPLLVRYEDIVAEPEGELVRIFTALGIDAPEESAREAATHAAAELPGMEEHRTAPDVPASVGRWRRDLDRSQQEAWTAAFADVLLELGYETNTGEDR